MGLTCVSGLLLCPTVFADEPYRGALDDVTLTDCLCTSEAGEGVIAGDSPKLSSELSEGQIALPPSTPQPTTESAPDDWGTISGGYNSRLIGLIDDTIGVGPRLAAVDFVRTFDDPAAVSARVSAWELFKADLTRLSQAGMHSNLNLVDSYELPLDGEFAIAIAGYEQSAEGAYTQADRLNPYVAENHGLPFYFTLHAAEQALLMGAGRATLPVPSSTPTSLTLPAFFSSPTPSLALAGGGVLPTILAENSVVVGTTIPATSVVPQFTAAMMTGVPSDGSATRSSGSALDEIADLLGDSDSEALRRSTHTARHAMVNRIAKEEGGADAVRTSLADLTAYSHEEVFDIFRSARLASERYRAEGAEQQLIVANKALIEVARDALRLRGLGSPQQAQRFDPVVRRGIEHLDRLGLSDQSWATEYGFALDDLLMQEEGTAIGMIDRLDSFQGLMRLRNVLVDRMMHNSQDMPQLGRLVEAVRLRYGLLYAEIEQSPATYWGVLP